MEVFLIIVTTVFATLGNAGVRLFEEKVQKSRRDLMMFMAMYVFLGGILFLLSSRMNIPKTMTGWLLAVGYGVCYFMANIGNCESFLCGPMSLSNVISSCSVLFPIVFGCIAYQETMTLPHVLGIACLFVIFILTGVGTGGDTEEISLRWIVLVLLSFVGSGFCAVITVAYSRLTQGDGNGFMAIGFLLSAAMLFAYGWRAGAKESRQQVCMTWGFAGTACLTAAGCFVGNALLFKLSSIMDASVLYPLYNGLKVVAVTLLSWLGFREQMTRKKVLILIVGICAIVLMNL